ncbi:hypothetical protein ACHAPX_000520 [Trichoderma viride]
MEDEKLPKTIEDGVSSHFERAQDIDPAIEKRHVIVITSTLQSNAKILNADKGHDLLDSTHMTTKEYTIALMVFLVAYSIFEAPSNLAAKALQPN